MGATYDEDTAAWAFEQARLIRAGQFDRLDLEHIADEIESVGKSERREIMSRMSVLLANWLKWQFQPERRSKNQELIIRERRKWVLQALEEAPSLRTIFTDDKWIVYMWLDAIILAIGETDLDTFPENCSWLLTDVLRDDWTPPLSVD